MLVGRWKCEREDGESMEELEFAPSLRRPGWILDLDSITSTSTLHHQECKPHQRALQSTFHRSNLPLLFPNRNHGSFKAINLVAFLHARRLRNSVPLHPSKRPLLLRGRPSNKMLLRGASKGHSCRR